MVTLCPAGDVGGGVVVAAGVEGVVVAGVEGAVVVAELLQAVKNKSVADNVKTSINIQSNQNNFFIIFLL